MYPQLLLARLFFSIGGAATSTMVTAILPTMLANRSGSDRHTSSQNRSSSNGHVMSPSISSEVTITPQRLSNHTGSSQMGKESSPTLLAGIVGLFTGCGALLALGIFLRLPELIERTHVEPGQALADAYYIVGALALLLAIICFFGLQNLSGEDYKGWRAIKSSAFDVRTRQSSLQSLYRSTILGFKSPLIGLGYLGGFVARASSVGISLFIPVYVNAYYISSGICDETGRNPQDVKAKCRDAYVLAAELTGFSQLVALLCAPIFGYLADRYRRFHVPLLVAALSGAAGYISLANLDSPMVSGQHGSPWIFVIMAALGISQIGAIVCSLGLLGRGILGLEETTPPQSKSDFEAVAPQCHTPRIAASTDSTNHDRSQSGTDPQEPEESTPLLQSGKEAASCEHLKGSIAGIYSLAGGAGILILTKAGGVLFDTVSPVSPLYMLAGFNLTLLTVGITVSTVTAWRGQ